MSLQLKQAGPAKNIKMSLSVSSLSRALKVSVFRAQIGRCVVAGVVGFF